MNPTKQQTQAISLATLAGAASAVAISLFAWRNLRPRRLPVSVLEGTPGTAVITGASSGIGAAFARALAARGYNLLLIARREARLQALAAELSQRHGIVATSYAADLSNADDLARLEAYLAGINDLVLMINNAGFGTSGCLSDVDLTPQIDMLNVHVLATMRLSKAVLPGMLARRRGAIINVSSIAAFMTPPENVNYSASKAYINSFCLGLQAELDQQGVGQLVRVQALCPGWTKSEFHDSAEYAEFDRSSIPDKLWMTAEELVTISLNSLAQDRVVVVPGLQNQAIIASTKLRFARPLLRSARRILHR